MTRHLELRAGAYHDSVALMQVSQTVAAEPGVVAALVAMATDLNLDLLGNLGFDPPAGAGPNDLLVAVHADEPEALQRALTTVDAALAERPSAAHGGFDSEAQPRTVGSAAARSGATIAVISTPGPYAFVEAMDALEHGLSVMVFSDNVPLAHEIRLKQEASRRGLLVMGPDCGTAVINGAGLGFANVVRPGPVGVVAASGTGAQQVMCLIDDAGVGVSHCLGVGGRDLSAPVGGAATIAALDLLAADPSTEIIVVISKPPAPDVADAVRAKAAVAAKPVVFALLGLGQPDLTAAAHSVVTAAGGRWRPPRSWPAPMTRLGAYGRVTGLFSGGTLCDEAMVIASAALGPIRSNVALRPDWQLAGDLHADGHVMIDFGDDELTRGRPHPMIDGSQRIERLLAEAEEPGSRVVLLDVVLGHGAHPDPVSDLAPAISRARERAQARGADLAVVVSLIGTTDDPQGLERQAGALAAAGASVHLSNAEAARTAVGLVQAGS